MSKGVSELSAVVTLYIAAIIATSTVLTSFFVKPSGNITSGPITTSIPITTSVESPFAFTSTVESTVLRETTTIESETTISTNHVHIDCLGNPPHGCYDFQDIESIDSFVAPATANCGETITLSVDWTGLHYGDKNYFGFFIDSTFLDSCETFAEDSTKYYTMVCNVAIPNNLSNGDHTISVTGWGYGGYCNPYEAGQYSKEKSKIITLNNCQISSNTTSSSTTTTLLPGESSTTSSSTSSSTTTTLLPGESSTTSSSTTSSSTTTTIKTIPHSSTTTISCLPNTSPCITAKQCCGGRCLSSHCSSGGGGGKNYLMDLVSLNTLIITTVLSIIVEVLSVYKYFSWKSKKKLTEYRQEKF
jgi:hypothetical protein